jgi:fructosamine-3-kinase
MNSAGLQLVQQLLTDKTGQNIGRLEASPVSGGDINRAYRLTDGQQQFFIKTNSDDRLPMFEAEMFGLDQIQRSNSIRAPRSSGWGIIGELAFLVMV